MLRGFRMFWTAVNITFLCLLITISADICPNAIMDVSPSSVIHLGNPVNLTCSLTRNVGCYKHGITIVKGTTEWHSSNTNSISVQDLSPPPGTTAYLCKKCKVVCGMTISVGLPPGQPRCVACQQEGEFGRLSCSWEKGRETYIGTNSTLQLWQKMQNVTISYSSSTDETQSLTLPISVIRDDEYTALVMTSNELGTNVSLPYIFTYFDAVKPLPPTNITLNCHRTSENCTVTVHTDQDTPHFRLQYRAVHESVWQQVEILTNRTVTLHNLRPSTPYQFQAACKYRINRGKWSNWSQPVTYETPEDAPRGKIEVWYKLHNINHKSQTITLFWKSMEVSEVRSQIQFYRVTFQPENVGGLVHIDTTTNTWFTRDIDTTNYVIAVSAHNSKGNSPPTYTTVTAQETSESSHPALVSLRDQGLLAPSNVIATTSPPDNSMTLSWELQTGKESLAGDQIVEWDEPTGINNIYPNWVKVPKLNRSVTISGLLKPHVCYQFRVYLLWGGRAGVPAITTGSMSQKAPLTAPLFHYKVVRDKTILVTWEEISPEQQMGCIVHHSFYLRDLSAKSTRKIKIFSNQSTLHQYEMNNIKENIQYILWMTCSNEAGESPSSLIQQVYLTLEGTQKDSQRLIMIIFIHILLAIFLTCILYIKQRLLIFLSGILPYWCSKTVPDPANCEWAKEYISSKDKMGIAPHHPSDTSNYDETETLEIEEMVSVDEIQLPPPFINSVGMAKISPVEENEIIPPDDVEGLSPILTLQTAEHSLYKSLESPHPIINESPTDYLVNHHITVDYLPTNMLNIMVDESRDKEVFQHQFFMPEWMMTPRTIRLDTVQINFPYAVVTPELNRSETASSHALKLNQP